MFFVICTALISIRKPLTANAVRGFRMEHSRDEDTRRAGSKAGGGLPQAAPESTRCVAIHHF